MDHDSSNLQHSDYIVYVDESGDHGLASIDPQFPVFVLAFCIFRKEDYRLLAVPALQAFKFRHFGHDMVVLHERDIRKAGGVFSFLTHTERREAFMRDLSQIIDEAPLTLIASVIQKEKLCKRYVYPKSPYDIALAFGLERLHSFLRTHGQQGRLTHLVFERRGKREDAELTLEFERVCRGANYKGEKLAFKLELADKRTNCGGLQLADLFARPIGRKVMDPNTPNRAFDIIYKKFYQSGGQVDGRGLKVFP
ncbi:MAG TPA: DUF3800 domain-containing protein [Thermoanaerobaculia bacterium]|nr:DUF3800 domain-containing protein [Thermoanaerobaculia bacterium]